MLATSPQGRVRLIYLRTCTVKFIQMSLSPDSSPFQPRHGSVPHVSPLAAFSSIPESIAEQNLIPLSQLSKITQLH